MKLHTVEKNTQLTPQTSQDAIECDLWTLGKVDKTSMIPLDNSFEYELLIIEAGMLKYMMIPTENNNPKECQNRS